RGDEITENIHLNLLAHALKRRDSREHGEGHGHHRDHREERGIGQCGSTVGASVRQEAVHQKAAELHEILHPLLHSISSAPTGSSEPAYTKPMTCGKRTLADTRSRPAFQAVLH